MKKALLTGLSIVAVAIGITAFMVYVTNAPTTSIPEVEISSDCQDSLFVNTLDSIKKYEGLSLHFYLEDGVKTIGYGHHILPGDSIGDSITQEQADELLRADILGIINTISGKMSLKNNQLLALSSLAYNMGTEKALNYVNNMEILKKPSNIMCLVYANGRRLDGLVKRRKFEMGLLKHE